MKIQHDWAAIGFVTALVLLVCLLAFGFIWFQGSMEARSYRKFCETEVSWWDAVWLDLRIDECP